jgi:hypothetical protein
MAASWGAALFWGKKMGFLLDACLDIRGLVAASICQDNILSLWLHNFPCSLQAKLHPSPRRRTPTPCLITSVFIPCIVLCSMDPSFIHSYEMRWFQFARILLKWAKILVKQALNPASEQFWGTGNPFGWELLWDITRVSTVFLADILQSSRIVEWMASRFFWNCQLSWSPRIFFVLSAQRTVPNIAIKCWTVKGRSGANHYNVATIL